VPLGMAFGSDAYYFALMPMVLKITNAHGIDPASVARAMMIGDNVGYSLMPLLSSPYLLVGLAGVELGAHIRRSLLYMWLISILMLASAVVFGAVRL
jgi:citrate-Mg2+:H+ or citrate-Ca2+:H+ symporter, CitMHS family